MLNPEERSLQEISQQYLQDVARTVVSDALENTELRKDLENADSRDDVVEAYLLNLRGPNGQRGMQQARGIATTLDQHNNLDDLLPENAQKYDFSRSNVRTDAQFIGYAAGSGAPLIPAAVAHYKDENGDLNMSFGHAFGHLTDQGKIDIDITNPESSGHMFLDDNQSFVMIQDYDLFQEYVQNNSASSQDFERWDGERADATVWGMPNATKKVENYPKRNGLRVAYTPEAGHQRDRIREETQDFDRLMKHRDEVSKIALNEFASPEVMENKGILVDYEQQSDEFQITVENLDSEAYQAARKVES